MGKFQLLKLLLIAMFSVDQAFAEEELPDWNEETLTGDWRGTRADLYRKGIDLLWVHKSDVLADVHGGNRRRTIWMGFTDMQVAFDFDKMLGWQNTTGLFNFQSVFGSKLNKNYIGSFGGVNNNEVSVNTGQIYQAWLQRHWLDDRLSVLGGIYVVDTEFYVTNASAVFLQPGYGVGNEFGQSGVNGPPIFPFGTLATRVKYVSADAQFYVQGALTDGVPGNPKNQYGTRIQLQQGDGSFSMLELGYTPAYVEESPTGKTQSHEPPKNYMHKTAIGLWKFTRRFDDLVDVDNDGNAIRRKSHGVYFLTERPIWHEKDAISQGLTVFFRYGTAGKNLYQVDWTSSFGLLYIGLIEGRNDDIAGIGMTINHASSKFQRLNDADKCEIALEITYKAQIKPWLFVQPNVHYVANPNMDKMTKNATVLGVRTEINF